MKINKLKNIILKIILYSQIHHTIVNLQIMDIAILEKKNIKNYQNVLKKQKITICRIPSSKVSKPNGCEDLIGELCKINPEFEDASQSIKRTQDIIPAHLGGYRDEELHKKILKFKKKNITLNI